MSPKTSLTSSLSKSTRATLHPPADASPPEDVERVPDVRTLIVKAEAFLARSQDADQAAATERAAAARQRLDYWLTLAKRLLPVIAKSESDYTDLVRSAFAVLGLPMVGQNVALVHPADRCRTALASLQQLWRAVPGQLSGALARARELTGNEVNFPEIEAGIRVSIQQVQNVEVSIADNLTRLRAALAMLLDEPAVAAALGGNPPTFPPVEI